MLYVASMQYVTTLKCKKYVCVGGDKYIGR